MACGVHRSLQRVGVIMSTSTAKSLIDHINKMSWLILSEQKDRLFHNTLSQLSRIYLEICHSSLFVVIASHDSWHWWSNEKKKLLLSGYPSFIRKPFQSFYFFLFFHRFKATALSVPLKQRKENHRVHACVHIQTTESKLLLAWFKH